MGAPMAPMAPQGGSEMMMMMPMMMRGRRRRYGGAYGGSGGAYGNPMMSQCIATCQMQGGNCGEGGEEPGAGESAALSSMEAEPRRMTKMKKPSKSGSKKRH